MKRSDCEKEIFSLIEILINLNKNKKSIFINMIEDTKNMKDYMIIHSVFDEEDDPRYDSDNKDWVVQLFRNYISMCAEPKKQIVPDKYIKYLEMFDAKPLEYDIDYNIIKYGLWKRLENGRIRDPIYIHNKSWENIHGIKIVDVMSILNKIPVVDLSDDLPF
jgi:hypothetical protein